MTPDDLRKLLGKMTPGPWINFVENGDVVILVDGFYVASMHMYTPPTRDNGSANADAICTLRNVAEALVELWAAVEAMRDAGDADDDEAHSAARERAEAALARLREVKHGEG